jgi:DNA-binding LacI/PurR family transcriptional regulator
MRFYVAFMRIYGNNLGMKAPVQAAIAEKLNLSQGTVSRALRNRPGIRPQIRAKVLEAASEYGYQLPSLTSETTDAQALPQGHLVGVMVHSPHAKWRREGYLIGMSAVAPELDVTLVLQHIRTEECRQILYPRFQSPVMRNGLMKAIILIFRWPLEVVRELSRQFTCISIQHEYPGIPLDVIGLNHRQGMHEMMEHLYQLGHRKIGFVGRCSDLSWSRARFAGYVDSQCQLGMEYSPDQVVDVSENDLTDGMVENMDQRWKGYVDRIEAKIRSGVTAWMGSSEWAADCVWRGLSKRGLRIPEDVSLTGFHAQHDVSVDCQFTTVDVPAEAMGSAALKRAVERLKNPACEPSNVTFPCSLRVGRSTAPPPTAKE